LEMGMRKKARDWGLNYSSWVMRFCSLFVPSSLDSCLMTLTSSVFEENEGSVSKEESSSCCSAVVVVICWSNVVDFFDSHHLFEEMAFDERDIVEDKDMNVEEEKFVGVGLKQNCILSHFRQFVPHQKQLGPFQHLLCSQIQYTKNLWKPHHQLDQ